MEFELVTLKNWYIPKELLINEINSADPRKLSQQELDAFREIAFTRYADDLGVLHAMLAYLLNCMWVMK